MDRHEDSEAARRLMERDEQALRTVIRRYGPAVHGMARRIIAEPSLAEEVAQDTFLALWRRPGAFDPQRGSMQSFLLGVARNKAIDLVRKEEASRRVAEAVTAEAGSAPTTTSPVVDVEERHEMAEALGQLTEVQREALVLAYFGGRTYREVAEELGIPEGTAKTRLRDGLTKLRTVIRAGREG